ncbi:MAG: hypothetical protein ABIZ81_14510 [Opitutaceae bacterium]
MCASLLSFFRAGPPAPRIALLSDAVFFTRLVPVVSTASEAEVAAQVELAIEALSPFPIAQLYHGHYWKPGLDRAFVFASYRRRFTAEQTAQWPLAQLVLPTFATVFGAEVAPATTLILAAPEGFTAVHWDSAAMPSRVLFQPVSAEATPEERALAREELVRAVGGSKKVVDLVEAPTPEVSSDDDEVIFRSGAFLSRLPVAILSGLDVRDKGQLAELRRAKIRDVWLWRTAMASAALVAFLLVGEAAVRGVNAFWQKTRVEKLKAQAPLVEKIDNAQKLATRIEELTTKRLLPMEMIEIARKKPEGVQWTRVTTGGLQTLIIEAKTNASGEIAAYRTALRALPEVENAESSKDQLLSNGTTTFTITITFKPNAIKSEIPAA